MGWKPGKFVVKHYRRGDIMDGEAFVLVPERDPAAIVALRAYASATPDPELAKRLRTWAFAIDGDTADCNSVAIRDKVPSWVATLQDHVDSGTMTVQVALYRLAGWLLSERQSREG